MDAPPWGYEGTKVHFANVEKIIFMGTLSPWIANRASKEAESPSYKEVKKEVGGCTAEGAVTRNWYLFAKIA